MYFTIASFEERMIVGSMPYGSGIVLPKGAALTSPMSCAATWHNLLLIDASWPE